MSEVVKPVQEKKLISGFQGLGRSWEWERVGDAKLGGEGQNQEGVLGHDEHQLSLFER